MRVNVPMAILQAADHVVELRAIERLASILSSHGSAATSVCLAALKAGTVTARFCAARVLGNLKCEEASADLIQLLGSDSEHLVGIAAWALGQIPAPSALRHLETARESAGSRTWGRDVMLQRTIDDAIGAIRGAATTRMPQDDREETQQ